MNKQQKANNFIKSKIQVKKNCQSAKALQRKITLMVIAHHFSKAFHNFRKKESILTSIRREINSGLAKKQYLISIRFFQMGYFHFQSCENKVSLLQKNYNGSGILKCYKKFKQLMERQSRLKLKLNAIMEGIYHFILIQFPI
ncbi:hypothetical protein ABPG72_009332, partial [Tetrahymena utriculariae]